MAYRNVHERFWTDPKVKQLTSDEKLLFIYLITNPHTHVSGIYVLSLLFIEKETDLSMKTIKKGIARLEALELAFYDAEVEVVWVKKMFSYQGFGMKVRHSVERQLKDLHKTHLIPLFCKTYSYPIPYPIDTLSSFPSPVPVPDELRAKEGESEGKPKNARIVITSFTELMTPDSYCLEYAEAHGINGHISALWSRMLNWHMKEGKGTKDLHASWRTWVDKAPEYNKDLFQHQVKPSLNAHLPSIAEIKAKKGESL